MTDYEQLIDQVTENGIEVVEFDFSSERICGLYADNIIAINKHLPENKKRVTLLEEWGHATMNYGNILDLNDLNNRKQEESARRWAYEKHMPIAKFIDIILDTKPTDAWELIETLDVPIEYFNELIRYYQTKYGPYKEFKGGCIWFDPIEIALWK